MVIPTSPWVEEMSEQCHLVAWNCIILFTFTSPVINRRKSQTGVILRTYSLYVTRWLWSPYDISNSIIYYFTVWLHLISLLSKSLEEMVITFGKNELKRFKNILSSDLPEGFESRREDQEELYPGCQKQEGRARGGALKITLHVLRNMNLKELADTLEKSKRPHI